MKPMFPRDKKIKSTPTLDLTDVDMTVEQAKDKELVDIKICLKTGEPSAAMKRRYIIELMLFTSVTPR